jgi:UDPglucose 6-dehydrogenase/GDP-mannose 6-dehydrogenase
MRLLESVIDVNAAQPARVLDLLRKHFPVLAGVRVAVLGLAFKPGTDDMRESPAIPVVQCLIDKQAIISAYDPVAMHEAKKLFNGSTIHYCASVVEVLENADAVLLLTRWPEFKELPDMLARRQPAPVLIDGRRMLDKRRFSRYEGIGLTNTTKSL